MGRGLVAGDVVPQAVEEGLRAGARGEVGQADEFGGEAGGAVLSGPEGAGFIFGGRFHACKRGGSPRGVKRSDD